MNDYSEIKHISLDDFKKIDMNRIMYVQLYTGEILIIDHFNKKDINNVNIKIHQNKEKKKKKVYALPKDYFNNKRKNKVKSLKKLIKKLKLINNWISLSDYNMEQKLKFYDKIPKRAKFWENESFDSSRSFFQEKRLKRLDKYNNHYNYYYDTNNYKPLPKESSNIDLYITFGINNQDNQGYDSNYNNQNSPYMNYNYLYELALGPFFSSYLSGQQQYQSFSNNQWDKYPPNEEYSKNQNYFNYYQEQTNPYYYNDYQNIFKDEEKTENINSSK